jgi:threonine dehydratase
MIPISKIQEARANLAEVVIKSPFTRNINLSEKYGCDIFLKREDMQLVRSFKIRGAYNKINNISLADRPKGIVCASAGNHAQGVAYACAHLGIKGKIFMPNPTPNQKINKVRLFGKEYVEVILVGDTYDDAYIAALEDEKKTGSTFIHPFNDEEVIAGQGTIAAEILDQTNVPLDYILVAVGGGGLISGISSYFKTLSPHTKIIAVEAEGAPAMKTSIDANTIQRLDKIETFADGIAVKQVGDLTFNICKELVDEYILVPEGQICSTILSLYNDEAIVVEPAGAISISALDQVAEQIKGKQVAIVVCGGNNDIQRTSEIHERALLHEGRKHYFIIKFPQRAGALRDFLSVLGPDDDISHFQYTKKNNRDNGPALVGLELKDSKDFKALLERMQAQNINYQHINNNPMLFEMFV